MKEDLLEKVRALHQSLIELQRIWHEIDWSIVPETVSEHYPFNQDLEEMEEGLRRWLDVIKGS